MQIQQDPIQFHRKWFRTISALSLCMLLCFVTRLSGQDIKDLDLQPDEARSSELLAEATLIFKGDVIETSQLFFDTEDYAYILAKVEVKDVLYGSGLMPGIVNLCYRDTYHKTKGVEGMGHKRPDEWLSVSIERSRYFLCKKYDGPLLEEAKSTTFIRKTLEYRNKTVQNGAVNDDVLTLVKPSNRYTIQRNSKMYGGGYLGLQDLHFTDDKAVYTFINKVINPKKKRGPP